jgi:predicted RNase H-like nuclease
LKSIPYFNDKVDEETNEISFKHLTANEIDSAKKIYDFIESFAAAAVNQSRLKVRH